MSDFHLSKDTLASYAAGTTSDGVSLLVASHLTYCAKCREEVARFETLGGSLLEAQTDIDLIDASEGPSLESALALIDAAPEFDVNVPQKFTGETVPGAILSAIGANEDDIKWKFRFPGVSVYDFAGYDGETVQLLRAKPGTTIPSHTHNGEEATLVLTGQLQDGDDVLGAGDVMQADHHHDHTPRIIGDGLCLCLIVMSGKMKFTGPLSRALNLFG